MRKVFIYLLMLCYAPILCAQDAGTAFRFLQLPASSHAAALGGDNVSIIDAETELSYHNPALLTNVGEQMLFLNYMSYLQRTNIMGAGYTTPVGERSMLAFKAQYLDFGTMKHTNAAGEILGEFSAKDMVLMGTYSFDFSDRLTGGVSGKFIYSNYEQVYSLALGVDLGLNYYDPDTDFSASLVFKNLGGQVVTFEDTNEAMPMDIQLGFTKSLAHAPILLSATLVNLHRWRATDFYNADGSKDNFGQMLLKHIVLGADILFGENFYASVGYNYRMSRELSTARGLTGFSIGAGLHVNKVKFSASFSRMHISSSSLLFNIAYTL